MKNTDIANPPIPQEIIDHHFPDIDTIEGRIPPSFGDLRIDLTPSCIHQWFLIENYSYSLSKNKGTSLGEYTVIVCANCCEARGLSLYESIYFNKTKQIWEEIKK